MHARGATTPFEPLFPPPCPPPPPVPPILCAPGPSFSRETQVGYQELVNAIIRPPRAQYEDEALGPVEFEFVGKAFKRIDFRLLNDRGHVLECRCLSCGRVAVGRRELL